MALNISVKSSFVTLIIFIWIFAQNVKGSCISYKTRKDISRRFVDGDVDTFEKMSASFDPNRVVFVASQQMRAQALLGLSYDPLLAADMTPMQWVILERIGRARYLGEMTHGKLSLSFTKESPKTLFYHRKLLMRLNLISKQVTHSLIGTNEPSVSLYSLTPSLLRCP